MAALYLSLALAFASVVAGQTCSAILPSNGPCSVAVGSDTFTYQGMQGFGQIAGSAVDQTGNTLRQPVARMH